MSETRSYEFRVTFEGEAVVAVLADDEDEARSIVDLATPGSFDVSSWDTDEKTINVSNAELVKVEDY
jgi:hypothetical protein